MIKPQFPIQNLCRSSWLSTHLVLLALIMSFPMISRAQWTYLPLPHDMRQTSIVTNGPVTARCSQVSISNDGSRACQRSFAPPSFASSDEVIETVPAGFPLRLLEVHYDQDGYALRVVGERDPFWIFEPHGDSTNVNLGGQPLENALQNVYTAHLAGDFAAIFGPGPSVQAQCFPGTVVIDEPIEEVAKPETPPPGTAHQVPEFDPQAAGPGNKFNTNCQAFIGTDGEYGEWGQLIADEITNRDHLSVFLSNDAGRVTNMNKVCPNFTRLTNEQKTRFWVWTFMSIAQVESTCRNGVKATVPSANGFYAQGLLQMENIDESLDGKRSIWARNPNPENACQSEDITTSASANLRCGLDAMANVLIGYHSCAKQEFVGQPPVITEENCTPNLLHNKWEKFVCLPDEVATDESCQDPNPANGHDDAIIQRILTFKACGASDDE